MGSISSSSRKKSLCETSREIPPKIRQEIQDKAAKGDLLGLQTLKTAGYDVHCDEKTLITALNHGRLKVALWLYNERPMMSMAVMFSMKSKGLNTFMKLQERIEFDEASISTREQVVGIVLKQAATTDQETYENILQSHGHICSAEAKNDAQFFKTITESLH